MISMEAKINIANILRNKPVNTKLYSPLFGDVYFSYINMLNRISVLHHDIVDYFCNDGRYKDYDEAELMLFPSKLMRDWSKFAWKRGDVLVTEDGSTKVIFECFEDDTYLTFKGKYCLQKTNIDETFIVDTNDNLTECFSLQDKNIAQIYIHNIEDRIGGMLNMETLEIEKPQPEFKDGDIVCISGMGYLAYGIVKSIDNSSKKLEYYVLNDMSTLKFEDWLSFEDKQIQPITETRQIILFDALAKKGKAWDAETKAIVGLKPKCKFKPFDKVLCRDWDRGKWGADFFSHYDESSDYPFICIKGVYKQCIPYNDMTRHLLCTTGEWKG